MGSIRKLDPELIPEHRRDLLGQADPEDYRRAALWWAASGSITGHRRRLFNSTREAFLSGLGIGAVLGAVGMMVLIIWLSA